MPIELSRRPLGTTGIEITPVGFGAWAIGGEWRFGWGPQDDAASIAAIRHAVSRGINWIDTAAVYGLGHSEEVVARALRDLPRNERPYVFTKCGMPWDRNDRDLEPGRTATPASIRTELTGSLRRLEVEQIDLYQVHWPPLPPYPVEQYWETMVELKREGLVRAIGLSNHDAAQLGRAEAVGHVDSLQPPFSMIRRDVAAAELPWCEAHDTGVIVYSPMQSGLLTGAFNAARLVALPDGDWRKRSARFTGEAFTRAMALVEALRPIAAARGVSVGAIAVAWTLSWPAVTGAIVGARHGDQVDGWLPAATLKLSDDELAVIAHAIVNSGAGSGPTRPG